MLRLLKIVFVALIALFGLASAFMNLSDLGLAYSYVEGVTTMPALAGSGGPTPPWATSSPVIVWLGVFVIVSGKLGAFGFCAYGAFRMATAQPDQFAAAKTPALFGMGLFLLTLFGGFTIIGENIFYMWMTEVGVSAAEAAARYGGAIALLMLIVAQDEPS